MKIDFNKITRTVMDVLKAKAPEICLYSGITLLSCGATYACIKTYEKAHKVVEINEADIDEIKNNDVLEEKEKKKEVAKAYLRGVGRIVSLYAGPIGLMAAGGFSIGVGYGILKNRYRNALLLSASLSGTFINYRERVANKLGIDEEEKLYLGIVEETVSEKITDENGKTKTIKKSIVTNMDPVSKYYIRLDDSWMLWNPDKDIVISKILSMLSGCQRTFERKGWICYNQLCEIFGFPECECPDGQLLGWIWIEGEDNQIKFLGLDDQLERFRNGTQNFIILNPNFDGDMHELIPTGRKEFLEENLV